jgi:hypothetical protein
MILHAQMKMSSLPEQNWNELITSIHFWLYLTFRAIFLPKIAKKLNLKK